MIFPTSDRSDEIRLEVCRKRHAEFVRAVQWMLYTEDALDEWSQNIMDVDDIHQGVRNVIREGALYKWLKLRAGMARRQVEEMLDVESVFCLGGLPRMDVPAYGI